MYFIYHNKVFKSCCFIFIYFFAVVFFIDKQIVQKCSHDSIITKTQTYIKKVKTRTPSRCQPPRKARGAGRQVLGAWHTRAGRGAHITQRRLTGNARLPQRGEDVGWQGAEGSLPAAPGELSETGRAGRGGRSARGAGGGVWRRLQHPVAGTNHGLHAGRGAPGAASRPVGTGPSTRHPRASGREAELWRRAGQSAADFTVVETGRVWW